MNICLVRYAEGAGGKFLMSLLMGSPDVAHYDSTVEENKTHQTLMNYIYKSFSSLDSWLANEPNHIPVWNLHWISAKMPRGEDQSYSEWLVQAQDEATDYFWQCVEQNKMILLQVNKPTIPLAYQDFKSFSIVSDSAGLKFNRKATWYKHFGVVDGMIHIKANDPTLHGGGKAINKIIAQFDNPVYVNESVLQFYRKNIWHNERLRYFSQQQNFHGTTIPLSSIINSDTIQDAVEKLSKQLEILPPDQNYVAEAHNYWIKLHEFNY